MIDAGWVAAIATVVTAVIIGGTAIAAFLQLRDFRKAAQTWVSLRFAEELNSALSGDVRLQFMEFAKRLQEDPEFREHLREPTTWMPEMVPVRNTIRQLCYVSWLVIEKPELERFVLRQWAHEIVEMWELSLPLFLERRRAVPPFARAFQHLAMRARRYIESGQSERDCTQMERDPR